MVYTTLANTGVAAVPTATGTFPVFEHVQSATMTGTNPTGSHYVDPGIPWVSYFNGGDALHGYVRGQLRLPPERRLRRDAAGQRRSGLAPHPAGHPGHGAVSPRPVTKRS